MEDPRPERAVPRELVDELARARRIVARSDLSPRWVEGAVVLAQAWADAEATERRVEVSAR